MAKPSERVVRLFDAEDGPEFPETPLNVVPLSQQKPAPVGAGTAVDLTGKPKMVFVIGPGGKGKTTLVRWVVDRALLREDTGDDKPVVALVDRRRDLPNYFEHIAMARRNEDGTKFLERMVNTLVDKKRSAVVDLGGGDTSLGSLVSQMPDLHRMLSDRGVEPVALYLLGGRQSDLSELVELEQAGFQPTATALVLNMGLVGEDAEAEFRPVRKHSGYQAALKRGAVEIWMPPLFHTAAVAVEDRMARFVAAARGEIPVPLRPIDQRRLEVWLTWMETAWAPCHSWLP